MMGSLISTEDDLVTRSSDEDVSRSTDLADILILLININESKLQLPLMLVVEILNYAGSLPSIKVQNNTAFKSGSYCDTSYLSIPFARSKYVSPLSLHLIAVSKDQGWSSYPSEKGSRTSHTWGELRLSTMPATRCPVFRNIHAGSTFESHNEVFSLSGEHVDERLAPLVAGMKAIIADVNDGHVSADGGRPTLDLVVRSMYPAWTISMQSASLEMRYQLCGDWDAFVERYSKPRRQIVI